jgi:CP family cyanate transporter-like MFS transporter
VPDAQPDSARWVTRPVALRIAGVLALALMLRPSIAGIGPIIDDIQGGLGLPSAAISALTALPVLCFGFGSLIGPALARRIGVEWSLGVVLGLLAVALLIRVLDGPGLLFGATVLAGGAVAVMNVLLPRLVKQDFAEHAGLITGLYTAVLGAGAAIAALIAVPLESWTGQGWRGSLFAWGVVGVIATAVWLPQLRGVRPIAASVEIDPPAGGLLRNVAAWALTAFMGLQSLSFYVCLAWLPSLLRDAGYSHTASGAYLSLLTALGIPCSLLVPVLARDRQDQRLYAVATSALVWAGFLGLLLAPGTATYIWVILLGIGTGSTFPLTLLMLVLRTSTPAIAGQLSAMVQGIGYLICAIGPFAVGELHDAFNSWRPSMIFMLVLVGLQAVSGLIAGRPGVAA